MEKPGLQGGALPSCSLTPPPRSSPSPFSPLLPGAGMNPGPQACCESSLTLSYSQVLDLISKKNKRTFQIAGGERESQRAFLHFQRADSLTGPCLFSLPISAISPGTSTCQLGSAAWVRFRSHLVLEGEQPGNSGQVGDFS